MEREEHYEKLKGFFRHTAIRKKGYFDALPGGPLKHRTWDLRVRRMIIDTVSKLLRRGTNFSRAIDVGCGRGDFTIEVAKCYPQISKVCGCDFTQEVLSIARKDAESLERVSFQETDMLDMPFKDKSFDLTMCIGVLHTIHKDDFERALSELARITNRYLVLEVRNKDCIYYNKYVYYAIRGKRDFFINVNRTSTRCVSSLLRSHGFKLRKQRGIFLFNRLSPMLMLVYSRQSSGNGA
jgi:ubiquinone/menaquinone biosynthesis C-methylase UbiE